MHTGTGISGPAAVKRIIIISAGLLFVIQAGCSSSRSERPSYVVRALQREQTESHFVIGRGGTRQLEYLNMDEGGRISTANFPTPEIVQGVSLDLRKGGNVTSDGAWKADCTEESCTVIQTANAQNSFAMSLKGILTSLYWSPDSKFVFYVRKAPVWRVPPRCSLEDERDVVVRDLTQHREGIVSTVCAGFPYTELRWYRVTQ